MGSVPRRRPSHRAGLPRAPRCPHRVREPTGAGPGDPDAACGCSPHGGHPWLAPLPLSHSARASVAPGAWVTGGPQGPPRRPLQRIQGPGNCRICLLSGRGRPQEMPAEGGGWGGAGLEGRGSGRLGVTEPAAPARPAQTAKVRSLLGPPSGPSHSRVPHLLIPRKGKVSGFRHRSFCNYGNAPPRQPLPPRPQPQCRPLRAPQGPSHCPQGLTTAWLAEQPLNPEEPTDAALERGST